ncbi:putative DNA-binding domain-containing protein [Caballeronia novacaledonica]|uniref:HvfC/BufC N-terminal domain-containing protein n=1 Tax=Caballeronia novacaledonica TaxID=1544861 RepID=UPI001EE25EE3|nr:DNA-binding domain-containing protein [Caballeronia novacaledonica]GJH08495.1 putative DNA-binding domain-containing protein [Caballeronia novacaledonica]
MAHEHSVLASAGTGFIPESLRERQRHFAAALLNPDMRVPPGLVGPNREASEKRFNVHRNNVVAGLVGALKAAFPAVCRIAGDEFFAAMARVYVALEPPRTPVMLGYGETFPDFIRRFEPAQSVPYLHDVARFERAWVEAYHAAEASPADPALLAAIDSRSLPQIAFLLHPSARVVRSSFPVVQIWSMNIEGGVPAAIDIWSGGESALVVRPHAEIEVCRLPAGAATFIQSLATNASVAEAATLALEEHASFDLAGALRDLFMIKAIAGWNIREGSRFSPIARDA